MTRYAALLLSAVIVLSILYQCFNYSLTPTDCASNPYTCTSMNININPQHSRGLFFNGNRDILQSPGSRLGHFSFQNRYQPDGCILSKYSISSIQKCLRTLHVDQIKVGGTGRLKTIKKENTDQLLHKAIQQVLEEDADPSKFIYDTISIGNDRLFAVFWSKELTTETLTKLKSSEKTSDIAVSVSPSGLKYSNIEKENDAASLAYYDIVINSVCNNVITPKPYDATCFVLFPSWNSYYIIQALLLILCIYIIECYLYVHFYGLTGMYWVDIWYNNDILSYAVLAVGIFLVANTGFFGSAIKGWNIFAWFVCSILVVVMAIYGIEQAKDSSILNREQTSEWRGWMQLSFLIYHYLGAGKVPMPLYIWIRMMVGGFMFMTGFGHTSYFLSKSNYSFKRVWQVLSRLNCLQLLLCCLLYKPWIFYYFTPLATVWFAFIYITLYIRSNQNQNVYFVIFKIIILIVFIELMISSSIGFNIFRLLFLNPLTRPLFQLGNDDGKFWYGRFAMDRFAVPCGMLFALFLKQLRSLDVQLINTNGRLVIKINKNERNKLSSVLQCMYSLSSIYAPIVLISYGLYSYQAPYLFEGKKKLTIWYHSVLSPFIIVAFVIIRNHPTFYLYKYVSRTLAWFGSFSLELFILQYHLLLAVPNDTSLGPAATLQLIPGSPILGAILASILLVTSSYIISQSTTGLLKMIDIDAVLGTAAHSGDNTKKGLIQKSVELSIAVSSGDGDGVGDDGDGDGGGNSIDHLT
jgi:hypothetical protein